MNTAVHRGNFPELFTLLYTDPKWGLSGSRKITMPGFCLVSLVEVVLVLFRSTKADRCFFLGVCWLAVGQKYWDYGCKAWTPVRCGRCHTNPLLFGVGARQVLLPLSYISGLGLYVCFIHFFFASRVVHRRFGVPGVIIIQASDSVQGPIVVILLGFCGAIDTWDTWLYWMGAGEGFHVMPVIKPGYILGKYPNTVVSPGFTT